MARKPKNPNILEEFNEYTLEGSVSDLIARLQEIVKNHPNARLECKNDYSGCIYESDHPEIKIVIYFQ